MLVTLCIGLQPHYHLFNNMGLYVLLSNITIKYPICIVQTFLKPIIFRFDSRLTYYPVSPTYFINIVQMRRSWVETGSHATTLFQRRCDSTGAHHSFEPGPVTKAIRRLIVAVSPTEYRRRMAAKMETNLKTVEQLERENAWIRRHGSPLHVMGLPDHAEFAEVRERYRDLVFDTHPDTAPKPTSTTNGEAGASSSGGASSLVVSRRGCDESDHEILQTAYKMATDVDSLFHRNNTAPALLEDLYELEKFKGRRRQATQITYFAIASYTVGAIAATIVVMVVMKHVWEQLFRLFDPEFYSFMAMREKEESAMRAQGIEVDPDPKQYAPEQVKQVLFPGRYVHSDE